MAEMSSVVCHREVVCKRLGMHWLRPDSNHAALYECCHLGLRNQDTSGITPNLFHTRRHRSRPYWTQQRSTQVATQKNSHFEPQIGRPFKNQMTTTKMTVTLSPISRLQLHVGLASPSTHCS